MHKNMHVRNCGSRGGAIPHGHPAKSRIRFRAAVLPAPSKHLHSENRSSHESVPKDLSRPSPTLKDPQPVLSRNGRQQC